MTFLYPTSYLKGKMAKDYPNNRARKFLEWFTYSDNKRYNITILQHYIKPPNSGAFCVLCVVSRIKVP